MDQGCVTIFSNDKVTQLEMLNSPHTLAPVCHTGPSLSAPPEGITLQVWAWEMFSLPCPLGASQTKGVLLGRDDPSASPPCSHHDVQEIEVSSSSLERV